MRLGGTVAGSWSTPEEWEQLLIRSRFRAVNAPFDCRTPRPVIEKVREICARHDVVIAEAGVWRNLFDPDKKAAAEAMAYAVGQLKLADETGIPCCVNISGTVSRAGWDAADPNNFTDEMYERVVLSVREILDKAEPRNAYYTLEPMPWMVPDGPDVYLELIRDVDRPMFAVHLDFVNMINCPRRYLAPERFLAECVDKLGPYIKSTHIKDTRMDPRKLTTILTECSPGEGVLDFERVLTVLHEGLDADAPVLLEHMTAFEEYARAYDCLAAAAQRAGVPI